MEYLSSRNRAFTIRSAARKCKISPGSLSEILKRKRSLTYNTATKIASVLFADAEDRNRFLNSVKLSSTKKSQMSVATAFEEYSQISEATLQIISAPIHYYLLELMTTDSFRFDIKWIARRLNRSSIEIQNAIDRLIEVKLVRKVGSTIERTSFQLKTSNDVPAPALRESHKQSIEEALTSLETVPVMLRDISSMTVAIDPARLPEAKRALMEFRRNFARSMECEKKIEIYNLNMQFVPVTYSEDF